MREMRFEDLEHVYEELAPALDAVGREQESLFLTKLVLAMAQKTGDIAAFREALAIALQDLPADARAQDATAGPT